jgi:transglutaminase-like putative cysteine protease
MRLRDWLAAISHGQPAYDPVPATLVWALAAWLIAWWAGGWVARNRPLPALLPALSLLSLVTAYGGGQPAYLLISLAALLLLMVLNGHRAREANWLATRVDYSEDIRLDVGLGGALVAISLVVIAGLVPSISIQAVQDWIRDLAPHREQGDSALPQALGLQAGPAEASAFDALRSPGLPRQHLIGSGPELSRRVVMTIRAADPTLRYYWRSASYDLYTGRGWRTSATETSEYRANAPLPGAALPDQRPIQVAVTSVESLGGILYYPGALVTASSDYSVAWRSGGDLFSASGPASYRAVALLTLPVTAQLRLAPAIYPEAIRSRYLALPDSVPQRVLSLARDLSAAAPTPFDRAEAIQTYVRAYPYTLDLPAPPPDLDVVDYYLFDLKRGYCDYAASAMVVLSRAAGLPARLVSGYAGGTWEPRAGRYVVTEADAHSWAEVYFAGFGWVEFEPTGGRPPPILAESAASTPPALATLPPDLANPASPGPSSPLVWSAVAGAFIASLLFWLVLERFRLARLGPARLSREIFESLARQADAPSFERSPGDTPYEFAAALAAWLALRRVPGPSLAALGWLAEIYVRACYSQHPPDAVEARRAIGLWYGLRWQLWQARYRRPAPRARD